MGIKTTFGKIITWANSTEPAPLLEESQSPLILSAVAKEGGYLQQLGIFDTSLNEFDKFDRAAKDDRVWSILELIGLLTKKSYNGIGIHATKENDELDTREKQVLETCTKFAKDMEYKELFYVYPKLLFKHGDIIQRKIFGRRRILPVGDSSPDGKGIIGLIPLPRNQITAVEKRDQILNKGMSFAMLTSRLVIQQANFYVLDEKNLLQSNKDPKVYKKSEILHIAFDKHSNWKEDLSGRSTYNVWSNSPLEVVMYLIEWKHNLVRNDMLWKARMLPREYYSLDMSLYIPENFDGEDQDARVLAAKTAAQLALDNFALAAKQKQADQGVVLPDSVTYTIVEPSSTNYHDPNDMIDQIDTKISSVIGVPNALLGGESKGFTSLVHSATFLALRIEIYGDRPADALEDLMKEHCQLVHPSFEKELIDKVYIKRQLILDRDLLERAKVMATSSGTKALTLNELREFLGKDPLTKEQMEDHLKWLEDSGQLTGIAGKTPEETADDAKKEDKDAPTKDNAADSKKKKDEIAG